MYMHVAWSLGKRILFRVNLCHLNNFPFPKRHLKKEKFNTEMEPSKKKRKVTVTPKSSNEEETASFVKSFEEDRKKIAKSVLEFNFNKKRIKILTDATEVKANSGGIVYWMSRDGRVQDNWAFLLAQKLALKNQIPLYVCFCLVTKFLDATLRPYKFLLKGLSGVQTECEKLDISFHLLHGLADKMIPKFVQKHNIGGVVCDFSPLRVPMQWVEGLKQKLPIDIPLCQVDAHNVVPVWTTSTKQEYAARTIRNKINGNLNVFLTPFPPVVKHPYKSETKTNIDWEAAISFLEVDKTVDEVDWARPGYEAGVKMLEDFCNKRLKIFSTKRNDPLVNALSNLSPWFHFGQISVQRSILAVQKYKSNYPDSVAAFCEEAIVRRELSDNFCYYNKNYDNLEGIAAWAKQTLNDHRLDKRNYVYSLKQLDDSKTHDDLWNAAQVQLRREGKMHGFLRMYWAKKILEWTKKPEDALSHAIYLNDRYSLDGRDPNGYVGCMWSIGGVHDQGWAERAIFGKIRFMNYDGCKRKFDVKAFVARYGNKA